MSRRTRCRWNTTSPRGRRRRPASKTSITPALGEVAAGDEVRDPPRIGYADHDAPLYVFYQRAPPAPVTKTSRRPDPTSRPPVLCRKRAGRRARSRGSRRLPPFVVVLSQTAPSVPRAKTSITPAPGEVAAGDEVRNPPRDWYADHDAPFRSFHQRAPPAPVTKTSRRPAPDEQAAGPVPEASRPPSEVQGVQEAPPFVVVLSQTAPPLPRAKTSITPALGEVAAGVDVGPAERVDVDQIAPSRCSQ